MDVLIYVLLICIIAILLYIDTQLVSNYAQLFIIFISCLGLIFFLYSPPTLDVGYNNTIVKNNLGQITGSISKPITTDLGAFDYVFLLAFLGCFIIGITPYDKSQERVRKTIYKEEKEDE